MGAEVTVTHKEEDGTEVSPAVKLTGQLGTTYKSVPVDKTGWKLKTTPSNNTGDFTTTAQTVNYVYEKVMGAEVTVTHKGEDGTEVSPAVKLTGQLGTTYKSVPVEKTGWKLKTTPSNHTGNFTTTSQTVNYVYEKVMGAEVTVTHKGEDGTEVSLAVKLTGQLGTTYKSVPVDKVGWKLKTTPSNNTGNFTTTAQTVNYVYEKVMGAEVTVTHKGEDGTEVSPSVKLTGQLGTTYKAVPVDKVGWKLKTTPSNNTGDFTTTAQTVNYIYEKTVGTITVKHIDTEGKEYAPDVVTTEVVGTTYKTKPVTKEGWRVKTKPESEDLTYTKEAQIVTYVYEKIPVTGTITVKHEDTEGKEYAPDVVTTEVVGTTYKTKPVTKEGWRVKTKPESEDLTYTKEAQTVKYVYEKIPVMGTITVKHEDTEGKEYAPDVVTTEVVGTTYKTKPVIKEGWRVKTPPPSEDLTYTKESQTVTYVYEKIPVTGTITVKHKDTEGKEYAPDVVTTEVVGTTYKTKPVTKEGWRVKTKPESEDLTYTKEAQTVTYVYEKIPVTGTITVKHEDTEGKEYAPDVVTTEVVGTTYKTKPVTKEGWRVKTAPTSEDLTYTKEAQTVTYVYEKIPVTGTITVKHEDTEGGEYAPDVVTTEVVGTTYKTKPVTKEGWRIKTKPESEDLTYTKEAQTVTYVYEKIPVTGTITVKHEDTEGEEYAPDVVTTEVVGTTYKTKPVTKEGWRVKTKPESEDLTYTKESQTVTYVYEKIPVTGTITVKHIDTEGKEYAPDVVTTEVVGTTYRTKPVTKEGWRVKTTPTSEDLTYTKEAQTVTYVYEKIPVTGTITVKHIDTEGKEYAPDVVTTEVVGTTYKTKPVTKEGWRVKTKPESEDLTYTKEAQIVTYVYEKIPVTGTITVKHEDTEGKEYAPDVVTTEVVGTTYKAKPVTKEGWRVKTAPTSEDLTYTKESQTVTYVYEKIPVTGTITVKHIDTEGKEYAPDVVTTEVVGTTYRTKPVTKEGWRVKTTPTSEDLTYTKESQIVTYVYEKIPVTGTITVKHEDTEGKEYAPDVVTTEVVGTTYKTKPVIKEGWRVKTPPTSENLTYTKESQTVKYVYEKIPVTGTITVKHIDTEGKEYAPDVVTTEVVGTTYKTKPVTKEGWRVKTPPTSEDLTYTKESQTVTYVYEKIPVTGTITVKHEDTEGKEYAPDVVTTEVVGTTYKTKPVTKEGWRVKRPPTSEDLTYTKESQTVIYVYEKIPVTGTITVKHEDTEGGEYAPDVVTTEVVGTTYKTKPVKKEGWRVKTPPTSEDLTYTKESQTVTYVYEKIPVTGTITVKHIDTEGKEYAPDVVTTEVVGTTYKTKPVTKEGWRVKTKPESEDLTYTKEAQTVTYVYEKIPVTGTITVKHIDTEGGEYAPDVVTTEVVGTTYKIKPVTKEGWRVKTKPESEDLTYTKESQTVTYVYEKIPVTGTITVKHEDTEGGEYAPDVVTTEVVGTTYKTKPVTKEGWRVKTKPESEDLTYTKESQTVTYVYEKIPVTGTITVKHIDTEGKEYAPDVVTTEVVGTTYKTKPVTKEGWRVKTKPESEDLTYTKESQTVKYVYEKIPVTGTITVKHEDTEGGEYAPDVVTTEVVGTTYKTKPVTKEGWRVKTAPTSEDLTYTKEAQTVTYVYEKIPVTGTITVKHIDTEGKEYAPDVVTMEVVGTTYKTKPVTKEGWRVKTAPTSEDLTYTKEAQTVTYVYEKIPVTGTITVKHIDTEGKEYAPDLVTTEVVGTTYKTKPVTKEGWRVKTKPESEDLTYTKESQTVIYVYEKIPVTGTITVKHEDTEGGEYAPDVVTTEVVGTTYKTKPVKKEGWRVKTPPTSEDLTYTKESQTVTYVYEKIPVTGTITVKHEDTEGKEYAPDVVTTEVVGTTYKTKPVIKEGWRVKTPPTSEDLTYTKEAQTVTYVYEKIPVTGTITVKHEDTEGKEYAPDVVTTEVVGTTYKTKPVTKEGWRVKTKPESEDLTYTKEVQTVTYVYEKIPVTGTITVKHIDTEGKEYAPDVVTTEVVGTTYKTKPVTKEGWRVKTKPESEDLTYTKEAQTVTYVYEKIPVTGTITVKHEDTEGGEYAPDVVTTEVVGTTYKTKPVTKEGWRVKTAPTSEDLTYTKEAQTVTYVYEKIPVTGTITIKHEDTEGEEYAPDVVTTEVVGTTYKTKPVTKEGWRVKTAPTSEDLTYTKESQTVTYVYEKIPVTGTITVKHEDTEGGEYAPDVVTTEVVGTTYKTKPVTKEGWRVKTKPESEDLTYTKEAQIVTYVYEKIPVTGTITVKHEDTEGKEYAPDVATTEVVGTTYKTKPVTKEGWRVKTKPESEDLTYTKEAQTVKYVYEKIPTVGKVIATHKDSAGNEVAKEVVQEGQIGEDYQTKAIEIDGWELIDKPAGMTGKFTEKTQTVNYIYKKVTGKVKVIHVDNQGTELAKPQELSGQVGTAYQTKEATISGWVLTEKPLNQEGLYSENGVTVTYVYRKTQSTVTVKHVTSDGQEVAKTQELTGDVGSVYETKAVEQEAWKLITVPSNGKGIYTEAGIVVTYIYEAVQGTVTVKFETALGEMVAPIRTLTGQIGTTYQTEAQTVSGWNLLESHGATSGNYEKAGKTVVYIYEKAAVVTHSTVYVNYVDEAGNDLLSPITIKETIGSTYYTQAKAISGWELIEVPGNSQGVMTEEEIVVNYVYRKTAVLPIKSQVTVKYLSETNEEIAQSVILQGIVNQPYKTEAKAISGYRLVETPANSTGKYSESPIEVIYRYEKDQTVDKSTVTVTYRDGNGDVLEVIVMTGTVGESYQTVSKEYVGWLLDQTPQNQQGVYTAKETHVTYTYKAHLVEAVVNYVDSQGTVLAAADSYTGQVGTSLNVYAKEVTGYHVIGQRKVASQDVITIDFIPNMTEIKLAFIYDKNTPPVDLKGTVTVLYVDTKGQELSKPKVLEGVLGEGYQTTAIKISGYKVISIPENANGQYSQEPTTVKYVYEEETPVVIPPVKESTVTVNYLDEKGKELASQVILTAKVGEKYQTKAVEIKGYKLMYTPKNAQGSYTDKAITVNYVYKKIKEDTSKPPVEKPKPDDKLDDKPDESGKPEKPGKDQGDVKKPAENKEQKNKKLLPQTSEAVSYNNYLFGWILVAFYLYRRKVQKAKLFK
ncbi:MucBP domain-containing protein [Vagococcus salmoninarum]